MTSQPITSVFNDGYIAEVFEAYRRDPASVDESWRQYFRVAEGLAGMVGARAGDAASGAGDPEFARKVAAAAALVQAIRQYGHLAVQLDPLGSPPPGAAELTPAFHGLEESDLAAIPASALGFGDRFATATEVVARLRHVYASTIGYEFLHLQDDAERQWFREVLRDEELTRPLTADEKKALLRRLTEVDGLERFLGFGYQGKKRFSIEGTDALVPVLDAAIAEAGTRGAREVVIGMAHRGRLNVLTHVMGKPYEVLFAEFEGRHPGAGSVSETGDVKYHMGYEGERDVNGVRVGLRLIPNPSHLEFVNPVINGVARANQRVKREDGGDTGEFDERRVLTICVHGDAAFIGEGVVAETFNLSRLAGYRVGGTLHVIVNNQVGFTTDPTEARSTYYASDLAKGFDVPVMHVNADDAHAYIAAVRVGLAYRERFAKDFVIDLVGYRRHGHNETDEPAFTQPELYTKIRAHPTPRQVWGARLVSEGVMSADEVEQVDRELRATFQTAYDAVKASLKAEEQAHATPAKPAAPPAAPVATAVDAARLAALNAATLAYPEGFTPNARLAKILARRTETLGDKGGIEWGQAEALAFASLVTEGTSVRLTGQDAERGTFGHRNAVLHDANTGATYTPLAHLEGATGAFHVYNSPLSETAVMGFDYGFSLAAPDTLSLWEAQYGDFVNVAQPIMDQYLVADRAKWGMDTGLVLLLPHGYEGGGPEHSSARLERFLQMAAEGNMTVAYPSTPAQYFHVLRRQARRDPRRPMVLMQPKSLLRLPQASSTLAELAGGAFQPVIDDATVTDRAAVQRVVLCTGKMFYDLSMSPERSERVAIVRVEELYPWPGDEIARVVAGYVNASEIVWAQEEPMNMGAWTFVAPRLRRALGASADVRYVGRPERASPAEGYEAAHKAEQQRIVSEALGIAQDAPAAKGKRQKAQV
jgi:2-oxoglutarate dehydrogenase E1 component